jgi:MFS family permease
MSGRETIAGTEPASALFGARFLMPLLVGTTLNPMNSSMLATALTPISRAFPTEASTTAWLVAALYLTAAVAQPVLGGVADRIGARRTLLAGLVVVAMGGVLGALAPTMLALIASRVLVGLGTSAGYPCAVMMIRERAASIGIEPPSRMLGMLSLAASVSMALGPVIGGVIIATLGWRWIFLVNLPLAVLSWGLIVALLPPDRVMAERAPRRFDVPGILLFTAGMTALMLFLMHLSTHIDWLALTAAVVLLAVLVLAELRNADPFIDVRMIAANRNLAATYSRHVVLNLVLYGLFYTLPQWSQTTLGLSTKMSGMVLLPVAVLAGLGSLAPTRGRVGRWVEIGGNLSLIVTCTALLLLGQGTTPAGLMLIAVSCGIGNGTLSMANQQRLLDYAPPEQMGTAAGLLRTAQYTGAILSAALTAYLLGNHLGGRPMQTLATVLLPLSIALLVLLAVGRRRG